MRVAIVASAHAPSMNDWQNISKADFIIAADAGAQYFRDSKRKPDIIIGDMDSMDPILLGEMSKHSEVQIHPVDKNHTDLELCLQEAERRGASQIQIFSWADHRIDYCLDGLYAAAESRKPVIFFSTNCQVHILNATLSTWSSSLALGTKVSIYSLRSPLSLRSTGLKWELNWLGSQVFRSQSNCTEKERIQIDVREGSAFLLFENP